VSCGALKRFGMLLLQTRELSSSTKSTKEILKNHSFLCPDTFQYNEIVKTTPEWNSGLIHHLRSNNPLGWSNAVS